MITVIIPALNEEKIIGQVVRIAKQSLQVTEVIMVDDNQWTTPFEEARKEGASIITSTDQAKEHP